MKCTSWFSRAAPPGWKCQDNIETLEKHVFFHCCGIVSIVSDWKKKISQTLSSSTTVDRVESIPSTLMQARCRHNAGTVQTNGVRQMLRMSETQRQYHIGKWYQVVADETFVTTTVCAETEDKMDSCQPLFVAKPWCSLHGKNEPFASSRSASNIIVCGKPGATNSQHYKSQKNVPNNCAGHPRVQKKLFWHLCRMICLFLDFVSVPNFLLSPSLLRSPLSFASQSTTQFVQKNLWNATQQFNKTLKGRKLSSNTSFKYDRQRLLSSLTFIFQKWSDWQSWSTNRSLEEHWTF